MLIGKKMQEHMQRLKRMGWTFIGLATASSLIAFLLPHDETNYWLSQTGKQGTYVLASFFFFLGLYCLGAVWRKRHFVE